MSETSNNESPKTILVLKSHPLALQSAEQFLRSRGWVIYSTVGLPESIQILFEKKIDYFLICANHPQRKVKTFPKLLSQFQNIRLITYTDIANTLNMAILQDMGVPYQILPPVSGPAIERTIFRIEKEILLLKESGKNSPSRSLSDSIKAPTDRKRAQERLNLFFSTDNDDSLPTLDDQNDNETEDKVETFAQYEERIRNLNQGEFAARISSGNIAGPNLTFLSNSDSGDKGNHGIQKAPPALQKGIEHALESSVNKSNSLEDYLKIERTQNCICLNVESSTFRGYLVAVMGQNRRFDDDLLQNIQSKLYEFLRKEGLIVNEDEPVEIKIRPVDFESWALEKAEFLKKSIHDGSEVAMAFFPIEKLQPNFGKSIAVDMISIDIDDLVTDQPVTFDVYVYLPANNKYILYTPKGGVFMNSQKERLKAKGVDKMHTKKEYTLDIKKYHIENTLNSSIADYESKPDKAKKKA